MFKLTRLKPRIKLGNKLNFAFLSPNSIELKLN